MNSPLLQCPKCRGWLLEGVFNLQDPVPCPSCQTPLQVEIFPALFRRTNPGQSAETIMLEGESSCFFHPQKKAIVPCAGCGRFLCALCDCVLNEQHFCPTCLETGRTKGKIKSLENQRTLYDSTALAVALYPLLPPLWMVTCITAPISLFIAIRYWNAPRGIVHRTKIRYVIAISMAGLQIIGWGVFIFLLIFNRKNG